VKGSEKVQRRFREGSERVQRRFKVQQGAKVQSVLLEFLNL
jgi:hypothetical protein